MSQQDSPHSMAAARHPWLGLLVLLIVCFAVAGVSGLTTTPNIANWYAGLSKPSWTPSDWVFGPVWSILYLSMAVAAWLVWRQNGWVGAAVPMVLFAVQLALNAAWSWLFFGLHSPGAAFVDILLLLVAIAATMTVFCRRSTVAGILFVPYLMWVSFASALNFAIWQLNG
jgi:tryptophan-rich sensory protein